MDGCVRAGLPAALRASRASTIVSVNLAGVAAQAGHPGCWQCLSHGSFSRRQYAQPPVVVPAVHRARAFAAPVAMSWLGIFFLQNQPKQAGKALLNILAAQLGHAAVATIHLTDQAGFAQDAKMV